MEKCRVLKIEESDSSRITFDRLDEFAKLEGRTRAGMALKLIREALSARMATK